MPSSARELASGPTSTARPPTRRPASSSASSFAAGSSPQIERVLVGRLRAGEVDRRDRLQARGDRRADQPRRGSRPASPRRGPGTIPVSVKRRSLATQSTGVSPIASREARSRSPAPRSTSWPARPGRRRGRRPRSCRPRRRARAPARAPARRRGSRCRRPRRARAAAARARGRRSRCRRGSRPSPQRRRGFEHGLGDAAAALGVVHQRARDDRPHARPRRPRRPRRSRARRSIPCNSLSTCCGPVPPASRASIRAAGPRTASPPISGLTATAGTRPALERLADPGDGQDRADADERVARRDRDQVGGLQRLEHARRGPRGLGALEAHAVHLVAVAARDEPLLERQLARRASPATCAGARRSRAAAPARARRRRRSARSRPRAARRGAAPRCGRDGRRGRGRRAGTSSRRRARPRSRARSRSRPRGPSPSLSSSRPVSV